MRDSVTPGRIITVRHGRPDLAKNCRLSSAQYGEWWAKYDESGLAKEERPPTGLIEVSASAKSLLSSTLPRARETAAWLAEGRNITEDAIFVEAPLPPPPVPFLKCGPRNWGWISRTFWILGYSPGVEGVRESFKRADQAADRLIEIAHSGQDVLLCAHGFFNWMLSVSLRLKGWRRIYNGGHAFWSWREFVKR